MKKSYLLFCLVVILLPVVFAGEPQTARGAHDSKLLSDWVTLHLKLVRNTKGQSQGALFRQFSYSSVAFYESIVPRENTYQSLGLRLHELERLPVFTGDKKMCWQASANSAMAFTLRAFYNSNPAGVRMIDSLENQYSTILLKEGYSTEKIKAASAYGKSVATAILEWAGRDGSSIKHPAYEVPKGEGMWEPTPPAFSAPAAPFASLIRTCVKNSVENTLPVKPTEFSSDPKSQFYSMVSEVYTTSQNLTDEQKAIALFWDDFPDGRYYGVAGHWASIFNQVVLSEKLNLIEAAASYVSMNVSMMDAFNACWKAKYTYNVLRPITYVQKFIGHAEWKPLIVTPAHPEYPAAHASMSMAAATALTSSLGNIAFTDHSYDDLGFAARHYKNFEEAAKEAGMSRLYGGIHYRPSIDAGYTLGAKTANNVLGTLNLKHKKGDSASK